MKMSYLHYSSYKICPKKYDYMFVHRPDFYIPWDKRYAFLGFVLAKLVERFYREKWWQDKEGPIHRMRVALPAVSQQVLEAERIQLPDLDLADWLRVAHETIPLIINVIKEEKLLSDECWVEREEEIPLGEDELQVRPDLIVVRKEIITLLDGKGGKTVGKYVDNDQLFFYCIIVQHIYDRLPHRMGFWWFRHSKIVWVPVTNEAVEEVKVKAATFLSGIKQGLFPTTPGQHCRLCDYKSICLDGQKFIASRHRLSDAIIPEGNWGEVDFA